MYGAGARKLKEMLKNIKLSNGSIISISEIWTINPMPQKGFSKEELASVDITEAEEKAGLLHHHYPCLASMQKLPHFNHDTLMHVSGQVLKNNVGAQVKPFKEVKTFKPGKYSE